MANVNRNLVNRKVRLKRRRKEEQRLADRAAKKGPAPASPAKGAQATPH